MLYLRWARFRRDHLPPARIWKPSGFCTLLLFHFSLLPYFPECIYRQARGEITNSQHGDEFCVHLGGVIFLFQVSVSAILLGGIAFKFRTDAEGLYGKIDVFTSQNFIFSFDYYVFRWPLFGDLHPLPQLSCASCIHLRCSIFLISLFS